MRLRQGRVWLLAALLAAPVPRATAQPLQGWGLPQLMQTLARNRSSSARFTERDTMHVLTTPLITSGRLVYVAPGYIEKTTTAPVLEHFVLDRGQITMSGGPGNQTHVFALSAYPQIGGLVEGIVATLAGDLPRLDRIYAVQLTGRSQAWQLLLQPKDPALARFITWIRIAGSGSRINAIDTQDSNGDHSEMAVAEDAGDAG